LNLKILKAKGPETPPVAASNWPWPPHLRNEWRFAANSDNGAVGKRRLDGVHSAVREW